MFSFCSWFVLFFFKGINGKKINNHEITIWNVKQLLTPHHFSVSLSLSQTVVGTDIADLLLKEHRSVWLPGKSPNEANLIDFNNEALEQPEEEGSGPLSLLSDTYMGVPENVGKETERFRELLLFGRKKVGTQTHVHIYAYYMVVR